MARQDRQGHRGCVDNVTRSGQALLRIINEIFERGSTVAIDSIKDLIGDIHVPA